MDNIKKYIIKAELDTSGAVKKYEDMKKQMASIDKKYGVGGTGATRGRRSGKTEEQIRQEAWEKAEKAKVKAEKARQADYNRAEKARLKVEKEQEAIWKKAEADKAKAEKAKEAAKQKSSKEEAAREQRIQRLKGNFFKEEEARRKRLDTLSEKREREAERASRVVNKPKATPRTFQSTQRFHNMNAGMGDLLSQLRTMPKAGIHPDLQSEIGAIQGRLAGLRRDLARVSTGRELAQLNIHYRQTKAEAEKLLRVNNEYNRSLTITDALTNKFTSSLKHMGLMAASVYTLTSIGANAYSVGKDMDSMRASLLAASKDSVEAEQNFKWLKETAFDLGKDVQTMVGGFNRLGVAAKSAGFTTAQTKEIFLAVAEASTTAALSNEKTGLVILAMSQMMSKGKVSMEEINMMSPCAVMYM